MIKNPEITSVNIVDEMSNMSAGITYSVFEINKQLNKNGIHAELWTLSNNNLQKAIQMKIFKWDYKAVPILKRLKISSEFRLSIQDRKFDILHLHGLWTLPNYYAYLSARKNKTQYIVSPHGMLGKEALEFSPFKKRVALAFYQNAILKNAYAIHATSESEADEIRSFGLKQPIIIIRHGVDLPDIIEMKYDEREFVHPYILSLGRIHPKKNLKSLIEAWSKIEAIFPYHRLRIVGPVEGSYGSELHEIIKRKKLSNVTIEPAVYGEKKIHLMRDADVFVLSTLNENFALTVAESLALCVPVISTKGAPWSGLLENRCGWWVDKEVDSIANAIQSALTLNKSSRSEMGLRGRRWMEREYSWDSIGEMHVEAYKWILGLVAAPDFVRFK